MSRFLPLKQYSGLSYAYDQRTGFYRARIPSENALDKATAYSVVFAGKQYNYSAPKNGALGNASLYDRRFPDTGEPFYFAPAMGLIVAEATLVTTLSYGILKSDKAEGSGEAGERLDKVEKEVERLSEEIESIKENGGGSGGVYRLYPNPEGSDDGGFFWDAACTRKITVEDAWAALQNGAIFQLIDEETYSTLDFAELYKGRIELHFGGGEGIQLFIS